jgi:hypothetical protein
MLPPTVVVMFSEKNVSKRLVLVLNQAIDAVNQMSFASMLVILKYAVNAPVWVLCVGSME